MGGVRVGVEMTEHLCRKCEEPVPVDRIDECETGDLVCAACPCDPDNYETRHATPAEWNEWRCWCAID